MAVNGAQQVNGVGKGEEVVASVLHGVKDLKIVSCGTTLHYCEQLTEKYRNIANWEHQKLQKSKWLSK